MAKTKLDNVESKPALTGLDGLSGLDIFGEKPELPEAPEPIEEKDAISTSGDYIRGLERFQEGIPDAGFVAGLSTKYLYEVIDDYVGWRILVGANWELITYLLLDTKTDLVSVVAGDLVDAYPKDTAVTR